MKFPEKAPGFKRDRSLSVDNDKKKAGDKEPTPGIKKDDKKHRRSRSQGSDRGNSNDPSEPEESPRRSRRGRRHRSNRVCEAWKLSTGEAASSTHDSLSKSSLFPEVIRRIRAAQVDEVEEDIRALFDGLDYGRSAFQEWVRGILKVGRINNVQRPYHEGEDLELFQQQVSQLFADTGILVAIFPTSRNKLDVSSNRQG